MTINLYLEFKLNEILKISTIQKGKIIYLIKKMKIMKEFKEKVCLKCLFQFAINK